MAHSMLKETNFVGINNAAHPDRTQDILTRTFHINSI